MISWDRVSLDWGRGIVCLTLILDISNIARVSIGNIVGDNLGAAVRKGNTVLAVGGVAITSLILTKVGTRVLISHSVLVSVRLGGELLYWGIRSRGSIGGRSSSESCGDESGGDEDLKRINFVELRWSGPAWDLP